MSLLTKASSSDSQMPSDVKSMNVPSGFKGWQSKKRYHISLASSLSWSKSGMCLAALSAVAPVWLGKFLLSPWLITKGDAKTAFASARAQKHPERCILRDEEWVKTNSTKGNLKK